MKNPVYQIRVQPEMLEFLNEAGPEVVRGWWRQRMSGVVREERALIAAPPERESVREKAAVPTKTSSKRETGGPVRVVPADGGVKGVVQTDIGRVPAWSRGRIGEEEDSSVLSGEAAPVAVAPVSAPRYVAFEQSEEERAKKMALLRSVATGMKMQPQMPPKTEFYPDDEPNEEP